MPEWLVICLVIFLCAVILSILGMVSDLVKQRRESQTVKGRAQMVHARAEESVIKQRVEKEIIQTTNKLPPEALEYLKQREDAKIQLSKLDYEKLQMRAALANEMLMNPERAKELGADIAEMLTYRSDDPVSPSVDDLRRWFDLDK